MYVRDAKNREEVWLLDHIEAMGLDDAAFRSRDYVVALDEETNEKAGFGRLRVHKTDEGDYCELTGIGVLDAWRGQGVGAHVIERLVEKSGDAGFDVVYSFALEPTYLAQFGFEPVPTGELPAPMRTRLAAKRETMTGDIVPMRLSLEQFEMPERLREAFKMAVSVDDESTPEEAPEDFGIDPESATYKYDTGR
ncbi:GNAT family N-acetyltransferase [Salinigranum halophilum]|jgi:N-acetylglutamate synthase-like GNAT family acetyltransferase|uniref:GNAT family N-acetyltransferase n=1 Tax=Salinigranum halophilum TaxID=2565931 RepID=UPI00115E3745|nr:GNAT family N-acetyltransferase [Salinigranum halophilum]